LFFFIPSVGDIERLCSSSAVKRTSIFVFCWVVLLLPASFGDAAWATIATKQKGQQQQQQQQHHQHCSSYDLVIIGAGSLGFRGQCRG
jgi:hypothetical protein